MDGENKVTSVGDYRRQLSEIKEVKCPSGAIFKIRRLTVLDYIKEGIVDIPNEFLSFIAKAQAGLLKINEEETRKNIVLFEKFLSVTIEKGIVDPPVIIKYDKDKIETALLLSEISVEDQDFLVKSIRGW